MNPNHRRIEPRIEQRLDTWEAFHGWTAERDGWAFRGEADVAWPLVNSLARRLLDTGVPRAPWPAREERAIRIFRRTAHVCRRDRSVLADDLRCLAMMQHHGAPTRLLDFTKSPFVAAFFALEQAAGDAAVYALNTPLLWRLSPRADHRHYEVFEVPPSDTDLLDETRLHFVPDLEGDIESVQVRMEPAVPAIVFKRLPDPALSAPQRLARLVGVYAAPGGALLVALRADGALTLSQGGAAPLRLLPVVGTRFAVQGPGDRQLLSQLPASLADAPAESVLVFSSRTRFLAPRQR